MILQNYKLCQIYFVFQGKEVPNSVQLFYIGCFVFIGSLFCEFIDKDDKFFTPYINEIPLTVEFVK